jgi:anti-sigma factor (TIGR02949 family)
MEEGASVVKRSQHGSKEEPCTCAVFRQQLTAFLYRDLSENDELLMELHRDSCAACRATLESVIPIDCMHVFQHISSYVDNEVSPDQRARMEAHFRECKHCVAVLDGAQNIIQLVADRKVFDVPSGFSERLYRKLPGDSY